VTVTVEVPVLPAVSVMLVADRVKVGAALTVMVVLAVEVRYKESPE